MEIQSPIITKEGLLIPLEILKTIGNDFDVLVKENYILIKPKSYTEKVRGIVKNSKLKSEDLEELYFEYKR